MIEFIWESVVKEGARGQFELAYGPGGAWSKLFARSPGFRGTTLLRDMKSPHRYLTIDLWDSEDLREQTISERRTEYAQLDATFGEWTDSRTQVGVFRILAESTVRPADRVPRSKIDDARRRRRRSSR
jgi:heme-degrading monooxygenase HmoA